MNEKKYNKKPSKELVLKRLKIIILVMLIPLSYVFFLKRDLIFNSIFSKNIIAISIGVLAAIVYSIVKMNKEKKDVR
jgi:hypothetical protein